MSHTVRIRSAAAGDVDAILSLLKPFAEKNIILERDKDNIFQHLQEFLVAEYDDRLAGVVCVHIYGEKLAEVRSLVVDPAYQKHGVGRLLVEGCEKWAKGLGVAKLFALTYVTGFFLKLGYRIVSKESLPHKVWTVCVHCARFADCDEIAVEKMLADTPIRPVAVMPIIEIDDA
ncbi:N-acetylglutamate synthase [Mariprofundus ferrinatatus]|uniref:Amino-acid acetyltransferase n=1 Tax=Mariprofundus ferrinatatus TaxID=1921087 RepID=A0A2K8L2L2_9PROT|nr:N-acetyltransferase [Mariprofundus ferrinatatus]ATX81565.1 N-acetylglutamate synthase [Mariprofundus ferrinatatus]